MKIRTLAVSMRSATAIVRTISTVIQRDVVHQARDRTAMFSAGVPVVFLHGVGESEGYTDEIITFALLGGLVLGLTFLTFRGARSKKKGRPRSRRNKHR